MKSIVILISGRGSNMEAILKANLPVNICAVISNRPDAIGLKTAALHNIAHCVVDHKRFLTREEFDAALAETIKAFQPDFIVLAGFMRVLGHQFISQFRNRIVNIHPSLLPSFPGMHTHRLAIAAGVKIHGATVHIVTPELDCGPILLQAAIPVLAEDTEATLAARVLAQEHIIYPQAIGWLVTDKVEFLQDGDRNVVRIVPARVDHREGEDFLRAPRDP
ncbi:MAG: phosphoribosylglycinamide formyltransferase [Pseudomonadota bacterium]